jgi:hypothetical protein
VGELSRHHVEPQPAAETDLPLWVNQQQLLCSLHPPNYQDQNPCDKATRDFDFSVHSLATLPFLKVEMVGSWMVYGRRSIIVMWVSITNTLHDLFFHFGQLLHHSILFSTMG